MKMSRSSVDVSCIQQVFININVRRHSGSSKKHEWPLEEVKSIEIQAFNHQSNNAMRHCCLAIRTLNKSDGKGEAYKSKKTALRKVLCKDYDMMLMHLYQLRRTPCQGSKYHKNENKSRKKHKETSVETETGLKHHEVSTRQMIQNIPPI